MSKRNRTTRKIPAAPVAVVPQQRAIVTEPAITRPSLRPIGDRANWRTVLMNTLRAYSDPCGPMPSYDEHQKLDAWLLNRLNNPSSDWLTAIIHKATSLQANRSYELAGGRNLVNRALNMLHSADGGQGFRAMLYRTALNYYATTRGGVVNTLRASPVTFAVNRNGRMIEVDDVDKFKIEPGDFLAWDIGPVGALYSTDSSKVLSTKGASLRQSAYPVSYFGEFWTPYDYLSVVAMPNTLSEYWDLGRPPMWRAMPEARIVDALMRHIWHSVDPSTLKGILVGSGVSTQQLQQLLAPDEDEGKSIAVIGNPNGDLSLAYQLLSRWPDNLDEDTLLQWCLSKIAAEFGYSLKQFVDLGGGSLLGQSGEEVSAGERRASSAGDGEFWKQLQEKMQQNVFASSLHFQVLERDSAAELAELEIQERKTNIVLSLYEARRMIFQQSDVGQADSNFVSDERPNTDGGQPSLITWEEARSLLAQAGIIPDSWTVRDEQVVADDSQAEHDKAGNLKSRTYKELQQRLLDTSERIRHGAQTAPEEPIDYIVNSSTGTRRLTLWRRGGDAVARSSFPVAHIEQARLVTRVRVVQQQRTNESELRDIFARLLEEQYLNFNWNKVRDLPLDEIRAYIKKKIKKMRRHDDVVSILEKEARRGRGDAEEILPAALSRGDRRDANADITIYADSRVDALFDGSDGDYNEGDPTNPWLPSTLNDTSADSIASAVGAVLLLDANASNAAIEQSLRAAVDVRAALIAETEIDRAYARGASAVIDRSNPTHKRWEVTTSQNPREVHLATVGEVVTYDSSFSMGLQWPRTVVNCKCGLSVSWDGGQTWRRMV